jgi:hypothetical protein
LAVRQTYRHGTLTHTCQMTCGSSGRLHSQDENSLQEFSVRRDRYPSIPAYLKHHAQCVATRQQIRYPFK